MNTSQSTQKGKKRRAEPFQIILIFDAIKLCIDICKKLFNIFEVGLVQRCYSENFSRNGLYFHFPKKVQHYFWHKTWVISFGRLLVKKM